MSEKLLHCHSCSKELKHISLGQKIYRSDECESCFAPLHCCKMCIFYDPKLYNECRETSADRITEKEKNNYCDFFELKSDSSLEDQKNSALDVANSLFKD